MRWLHMHPGFVFGRLHFRQVCVQQRRLAGIRVQVKERSVKISQEQRYDSVPGQDSSHARYSDERVPGKSIEVTLRNAEEFLNYLSGVEPGRGSPSLRVLKLMVSAEATAVAICMLTKKHHKRFPGPPYIVSF